LYTVSAQVALSTFHRPKPTCGIGWPELSVIVGEAIVTDVKSRKGEMGGL
jgi:hypothetical protein